MDKEEKKPEGTLFVLGNLLLDMIVPVEDSYLEKYDLKPDSTQTAQEKHLKIYEDVVKLPEVKISPGGSALNTVRMAQEILGTKHVITLIGAVGSDETGRRLIKMVEDEGIKLLPQIAENSATGKCASLLTRGGSARTMVTDLGASLKFSHQKFLESSENFEWLQKANYLYISGYFLKVSPKTVMEVVQLLKSSPNLRIPILLNLNAEWVVVSCKNELVHLFPYVDVIFGNNAEVTSFAELLGYPCDDIFEVAKELSSAKVDQRNGENRTVLITRGEQSVICADSKGLKEYPVPVVPKEMLLDSTGAGDAFVGGFLAQFVKGRSIDDCVSCGIWAATEELKGYGFIVPKYGPRSI